MNNNDRVTNYILILYYHRRKKKKKSIFDHNYFNLRPPPSTGPNIHAHTFFFFESNDLLPFRYGNSCWHVGRVDRYFRAMVGKYEVKN